MYRCELCRKVSKPHESRLLHVVERTVPGRNGKMRQEIAREIPVCKSCKNMLEGGASVRLLERHRDAEKNFIVPVPLSVLAPPVTVGSPAKIAR